VSLAWLRLNDYFAHRGWISSHMSRKIIHIGTGPLFVLCWLLFTPARCCAASWRRWCHLQSLSSLRLVGLGVMKDQAAVEAYVTDGRPARNFTRTFILRDRVCAAYHPVLDG